jgi:uncharacterized phage protein (TIGR02218 family)
MPFNAYERSTFSGQPLLLYEFSRDSGGSTFYWRYNSSDRDIKFLGNEFSALPISNDGIHLSGEAAATEFLVTMPITTDFCQAFRLSGTVPSDSVFLRVYRVHAADITGIDGADPTITAGTARLIWIGSVNGITQTDDITARVSCSTLATSFQRGGLRYGYQKSCPHMLYAPLTCKMNKESFRTDGVITAVTSTSVTATAWASPANGWFAGGFIEYLLVSGMTERRMVLSNSGGVLTLLGFIVGISIGDTVKAYAGCDRLVETCRDKFSNLANHGGFPHTPGRNPFDGQPVF